MEKLEKLLQANIAKMNILEAELQSTQEVLVSMFSTNKEKMQQSLNSIRGNFDRMRDAFDDVIKELYKIEEDKGEDK